MTKISHKDRCHTTRVFPAHRNWRAHIKWLSQPRMGIITPKFRSRFECCCSDPRARRRLRRIRSASERLRELAQPVDRNVSQKFMKQDTEKQKCTCAPINESVSSRLDQLAMPYVRLLVGTKTDFKPYMEEDRIGVINQHIQKSLHTVYSRLANFKMPTKEQKQKFTANDWKRFNDWMATRALPRRSFSEAKVIRKSRPIDYDRMDSLSKPRCPVKPYTDPGTKISDPVQPIPRSALNFEMTPRYEKLTLPFKPPPEEQMFEMYENPYDTPRELAKIKSKGIKVLAEPLIKTKRFVKGDNASIVFEVSKNAIKAKPSELVKKLAKPRVVNGEEPKANAFTVSRSALNPLKRDKLEYYTKLSTPQKRG